MSIRYIAREGLSGALVVDAVSEKGGKIAFLNVVEKFNGKYIWFSNPRYSSSRKFYDSRDQALKAGLKSVGIKTSELEYEENL